MIIVKFVFRNGKEVIKIVSKEDIEYYNMASLFLFFGVNLYCRFKKRVFKLEFSNELGDVTYYTYKEIKVSLFDRIFRRYKRITNID